MRHEAQEGPIVATVRVKAHSTARALTAARGAGMRVPQCVTNNPTVPASEAVARRTRATSGRTEAATEAVSDHLRRHAGR